MKVAVFALARSTFDTNFARAKAKLALACISKKNDVIGGKELLLDDEALSRALAEVDWGSVRLVVILQCSFCDANMALRIAAEAGRIPIGIWAWPEERTGERLRLNSFCGANLGVHALRVAGYEDIRFKYEEPDTAQGISDLNREQEPKYRLRDPEATTIKHLQAQQVLRALAKNKVALIGEHPDGFTTCAYDAEAVRQTFGLEIEKMPLQQLFDSASAVSEEQTAKLLDQENRKFANLKDLNTDEVHKALALHWTLNKLAQSESYNGIAIRCWPEFFTDYGCAVCGSLGHIADKKITSACEADVYGTITNLLLQHITTLTPWLVDIVDIDIRDNTAVLWHCGSAPLSMCSDRAGIRATIHSNRKKPLLREFALKPGRITLARLSQARGRLTMALGSGLMLERAPSFSGTSGVMRTPVAGKRWIANIVDFGLEHHVSIVYADCRGELEAVARALDIQVLDLDSGLSYASRNQA